MGRYQISTLYGQLVSVIHMEGLRTREALMVVRSHSWDINTNGFII